MELVHRLLAHPGFIRIQGGISALSGRGFRVHPRFRRPLMGVGLLIASSLLGREAMDESRAVALRDWENNHSPPAKIWTSLAVSYDLRALAEGDPKHRALRSLPIGLDDADSVWWNPQGEWLAVFDKKLGNDSPQIFYSAVGNAKVPEQTAWVRLGTGWNGMVTALSRLEDSVRLRIHRTSKQPKQQMLDPREIRF